LDATATTLPESVVLIYGEQRYTYAQLRNCSAALAAGLRARGITHGDRVAIWLPNVPLWVGLMVACARIGAVVVALNTRFKSSELGDILGRAGAKLLVYWPGFRGIDFTGILDGIEPACLRELQHVVAYGEGEALPRRVCEMPVEASDALLQAHGTAPAAGVADDVCVMFTTSGTTSKPKMVMHTQRSIAQHSIDALHALGYDAAGSVIQVVTPLCGVSGFGMPFIAVAAGAPCVLTPAFDARESLDLIRTHQVTHIHANHEIIRRWADVMDDRDDVSSLRWVNCGSGIAGVYERAAGAGIAVRSIYGSSELQARFSRQLPEIAPERLLEAGGFPLSKAAHVRAADIETGRLLPHGERGEIQVRAPSGMHGYFGDAAATASAITDDGYVRTGDCGYTRADGSFVHEARLGDVLKLSGFMVSPAEIEAMLLSCAGVEQCQVVGVPSARGMRTVAFVRADGAFDEPALLRLCSERMARYKVPARIIRLDAFPTTAGANAPKIQKNKLREMAQALSL
jgi:fatty-acyl-CoA synthase